MTRVSLLIAAAAVTIGAGALAQADDAEALRASGQAGEQADGYLGAPAGASAAVQSRIDAINIKRRDYYTDLATKRGATVSEVAATTACELLKSRVQPGYWYRDAAKAWKKRAPGTDVELPPYCG
jgi:uncharacterized protein YdbL (DUF1318 family)